jgi:UDP-3-O-[3-hydroxymyristoyl] glucosamine N-acyltransferase
MQKTLREIAEFIGGELVGDGNTAISGIAGIQDAAEGDVTFLANPKYLAFLERTAASAIITSKEVKAALKPIVRVTNPSLAFAKVVSLLMPGSLEHPQGIHPTALIGKDVALGTGVAVGAYTVIEEGAKIGSGAVIYSQCYVGRNSSIGADSLIYPHVSLREDVTIGNRVIVHSGTVIGSDGFGFVSVEGRHHKIPQVGSVVIEDDVEIGANVAIDRARFDKTVIGSGTKIDNLVHIAHNVTIGKNCLIVAQVGISGSTAIGDNVILAGQVGVVGHVKIGDNAVVLAQSGVSKSVPGGLTVWGYPAREEAAAKRINALVQGLPRLHQSIKELKKRLEELEKKA